jgi:drug/metabolite transporter (DMT)-like permease
VICGWLYANDLPIGPGIGDEGKWLPYALLLGVVFITGFTGAALTVRYFGVTVSQIMQKMSIIATVPFAILVYSETTRLGKILGIFLAIAAIILVNWPKHKNESQSANHRLWIPAVTWLLAAIIEITFLWVQGEQYVDPSNVRFISTVFAAAGTLGLAAALYGWSTGKLIYNNKNVLGGILLGIPNFGSMYFLLLSLSTGLEGSFVFPVVNVGIILTTTIGATWIFKEKLSTTNWLGVAAALGAILLMAF